MKKAILFGGAADVQSTASQPSFTPVTNEMTLDATYDVIGQAYSDLNNATSSSCKVTATFNNTDSGILMEHGGTGHRIAIFRIQDAGAADLAGQAQQFVLVIGFDQVAGQPGSQLDQEAGYDKVTGLFRFLVLTVKLADRLILSLHAQGQRQEIGQ